MMKKKAVKRYRIVYSVEMVLKAKNEDDALNKFQNIDLGRLDEEVRQQKIDLWDYRDIESVYEIYKNGFIKEC